MASIGTVNSSIGTVNFSGLVSGLDTSQIIDGLMAVDSKPLNRLETRKTDLTTKKDTFTSMKSQLIDLNTSISGLKSSASFGAFSASSSDEEALTLSASSSANAGTYKVKILSLAQAETLSSNSFSDTGSRLGLIGEILVNGKSLSIRKTDTLRDIQNGISTLNAGVNASILHVGKNDNRLIISAQNQGSDGLFMANVGGNDILGSLGLTDGTKGIRSISGGKVLSSAFNSATSTIGSLTGISSNISGDVGIRDKTIAINLSKDTLASIRDKINNLGLDGVSATVESESNDGSTSYRLAITGTGNFSDDNNILETLGIIEGGKSGISATFETTALSVNGGNTTPAVLSTHLTDLGAKLKGSSNETITISGTDSSGYALSRTLDIAANTTTADILTGIESAFSGEVTAELQNGKIVVQSSTPGATPLQFNIVANNENGGTLDFGTVTKTAQGRERQVVAGTDARIAVNNIEVTRSSNEINDVLTGLNLTLKKADPSTEITLTVERNNDEVQKKIQDFVDKFNTLVDFVKQNSTYDADKKVAGPLRGDQTTLSIMSRLRSALRTTVYDGGFTYNQLAQIGIESTSDGKLKLDTSKLKDAMDTDMDSVVSLFSATRLSSDSDISFVYHSDKTKAGTYDVAITRAADKAQALSDAQGEINGQGTIQITDNYGNIMEVGYDKNMTLADVANAITSEAEKSYAGLFNSTAQLKIANKEPVTQTTKISDIAGVTIKDNDTITINGTTRAGKGYQRIITLQKDSTTTIQDILNALGDISNHEVNATVDANGSIQIQDTVEGANKYKFSIETTVEGLDFGDFATVQEGRNPVTVEATVTSDNRLSITQLNYGSKNTFTISGAAELGIQNGVYAGVDISGTINGVEGTGNGQTLTASNSDDNTRGIVINSAITPEELADEGSSQGTITLISGIADLLYNELQTITNAVGGFLQAKLDGFDRSISSVNSNIDTMNKRLDQRRAMYVKKFTDLEVAMSKLNAIQQQLTSSLTSLGTFKLL